MSTAGIFSDCRLTPRPARRRLRVFAFDPQASTVLDTALINDAVIDLPWEGEWEDPLEPGPVNEYVEVVDYDPASRCFYPPVDLENRLLLAQNGLPPSDGNPQFHQQMVFAVIMKTVRAFERALGRPIFWMREATTRSAESGTRRESDFPAFVRRLRVYPHAMREANAYYSPQKSALLFGYFRGEPARNGRGGGWVFTCLSQDIVAHETTHAILHGFWRRSVESSNADSLAFHEAFADIVALLQHFSSRNIVEHELARSGGSLRSVGLLTGLAQQFGRATGREGPLRFALKMLKEEEEALAQNKSLGVGRNRGIVEPHRRGEILVSAVFDAFVTIFERRTDDLLRVLGKNRGDPGPLPGELVARLAAEAAKVADQVLRMCIRALDYLPPIDANFGEYLRAIITADTDLVPNDPLHYRTAFAEAFAKRGIVVEGQSFSSTETLCWEPPEPFANPGGSHPRTAEASLFDVLRKLQLGVSFGAFSGEDGKGAEKHRQHRQGAGPNSEFQQAVDQQFQGASGYGKSDAKRNLRDLAMLIVRTNQAVMHEWLNQDSPDDPEWERLLGIRFKADSQLQTIRRNSDCASDDLRFEVQSVRVSRRQSPDGDALHQLIVQVVQARRGYLDPGVQARADRGDSDLGGANPNGDFVFRGGATLIVDLRDGRIQRVIRKRIDDDRRLRQARAFKLGEPSALSFQGIAASARLEPFAMMHRGGE